MQQYITEDRQTGNAYHLIRREYACGVVDALAIKLMPDDDMCRRRRPVDMGSDGISETDQPKPKTRKNTSKDEMSLASIENSIIRARSLARRKILSSCPDRMLTLTFRACVDDLREAWKCFGRFNRLMRWRFRERWRYVCVPELQKRGAWHFHLAIAGYYDANTLRRFWLKAVGEHEGNVDITSPRKEAKKNSWNPRRIATYLAKYLTKSKDSVGFGEKRFSTGGDIPEPVVTRGWCALGVSIMSKLVNWLGRPVRVIFEGRTGYPLFFVSG